MTRVSIAGQLAAGRCIRGERTHPKERATTTKSLWSGRVEGGVDRTLAPRSRPLVLPVRDAGHDFEKSWHGKRLQILHATLVDRVQGNVGYLSQIGLVVKVNPDA